MINKNKLAHSYLSHSIKYLDPAEKVFGQMVEQGNKHLIVGDGKPELEDIWKDYAEQTKWSDFNIIFPSLFLFYHGIELMIKGLLALFGSEISFSHKSDLLTKLKGRKEVDSRIVEITGKYLDLNNLKSSPLGNWLQENHLNIDHLYERLRYPTDKSLSEFTNDIPLKYQEGEMLPFVKQIIIDSSELRRLFVAQLRNVVPKDVLQS